MGSRVPQVYGPSGDEPSSRRRLPFFLPLVLAAFGAGCGYFMAGTWEDDPGNRRLARSALRSRRMSRSFIRNITDLHIGRTNSSTSSKSRRTLTFKTQLFAQNKLRLLTGEAATSVKGEASGDAPSWFAPKDASAYEVWIFAEEPDRKFKVPSSTRRPASSS